MRIGARGAAWQPRVALVTGAGPVGLLAALIGRAARPRDARARPRAPTAPSPSSCAHLGATYHVGDLGCARSRTSSSNAPAPAQWSSTLSAAAAPDGIVCLAGVSSGGHKHQFDVGDLNRGMVLENHVVFGSVNANRRHYRAAAEALAKADKNWLGRLITRRVPLARWHEAFEQRDDDIKVVVDFTA